MTVRCAWCRRWQTPAGWSEQEPDDHDPEQVSHTCCPDCLTMFFNGGGDAMYDDDSGYDTSDPKHPGYAERAAVAGDHARKAARENGEPITPAARQAVERLLDTTDDDGERAIRFLLDGLGVDTLDDLHALVEYGRPFLNMRKAIRVWAEQVVAGLA